MLPRDLEGVDTCFSPGVCFSSGFELDCAKAGMNVFMADASVAGPAAENPHFHFRKSYLGKTNSGIYITLQRWVEETTGSGVGDFLMQMDIEGHEYDVIQNAPDYLMQRFRIIIVEFHGLRCLLNGFPGRYATIAATFKKLLKTHACVHAHPNNTSAIERFAELEIPDLMELTFLRRDRVREWKACRTFPHPLDSDNDPSQPQMILPKCWRMNAAPSALGWVE